MGANRRLRRSQQQQPNPDITIVDPNSYRGKPKPVLLTEPSLQDLASYGPQILQALRAGSAGAPWPLRACRLAR